MVNEVTRRGAHIVGANAATEDGACHDGTLPPDGETVVHREDEGSTGRAGGNKHMLRENLKPKQKKYHIIGGFEVLSSQGTISQD